MQEYPQGTKEYFLVDITDRLANLTTLDGFDLFFDIKFKVDGTVKYAAQSASNEVMVVKCLIDTTDWDVGEYQLWITINATPEAPRLGPFEFRVRSD